MFPMLECESVSQSTLNQAVEHEVSDRIGTKMVELVSMQELESWSRNRKKNGVRVDIRIGCYFHQHRTPCLITIFPLCLDVTAFLNFSFLYYFI